MKLQIERRKAAKVSGIWQSYCSMNNTRNELLQLTRHNYNGSFYTWLMLQTSN
jgi:hypothetical protein